MTIKELVNRICDNNEDVLKAIADEMLVEISTNEITANVFKKNYPKLVIQLLFITSIRFDSNDIINANKMKDAII